MSKLSNIFRPVFIGTLIALVGTIPRNLIFAVNLRFFPDIPWGIPLMALYLWLFWWYLNGAGAHDSESNERRKNLRAKAIPINC